MAYVIRPVTTASTKYPEGPLFSRYQHLIPVITAVIVIDRKINAPGQPVSLSAPRYSLCAFPASPKSVLMAVLSDAFWKGAY